MIVQAAQLLFYPTGINPSAKMWFTFTHYTIFPPTRNWICGLDMLETSVSQSTSRKIYVMHSTGVLALSEYWPFLHIPPNGNWAVSYRSVNEAVIVASISALAISYAFTIK